MSAAKHTPGPWRAAYDGHGGMSVECDEGQIGFVSNRRSQEANASLIATSPELLAYIEAQYIELADIHNEWPGRATMAGQQRLCRLRDLICKATGRESQDVQDDYGNRNLAKATGATP